MTLATSDAAERDLHGFIDAFESAWHRQGHAEPAEFLPLPTHPLYRQVLCELLRVDLELHWSAGRPKRLEEYQATFPALFEDTDAVREIALEECRLRRQAGEEPDLDDYLRRFGLRPEDRQPPGAATRRQPGCGQAQGSDELDDEPRTVRMSDSAPQAEDIQQHLIDGWCASVADKPGVADALRDFHQVDPGGASRVAQAVSAIPEIGEEFLGFRLLAELGRGAFGRVFLAQQSSLADRFVALKIGTDLFAESQTLAQLQHTNIVPIYSLHRAGPLQAVCMPFFGGTTFGDVVKNLESVPSMPASGKAFISTLNQRHSVTNQSVTASRNGTASSATVVGANANGHVMAAASPRHRRTADIAQLEQLSYVEAVLWVAARLAEGLAHAHDRGIVHRDLKPANILLADEGQPMLLDFNLSDDTKVRGSALGARMGGTLPYMSPEQLAAFQGEACAVDARSDVYSLGVILYELLSGRHPFPRQTGGMDTMLPRMLEDRSRPRETVARLPKTVSPAVSSIIRHCLEVDPARRYQSAHQLAEDVERHLSHLPLRYAKEASLVERGGKWVRRHPRWTVSLLVALVAMVVIATPAAWLVVRDREAARTAREAREYVEQEVPAIRSLLNDANLDARQLDEGISRNNAVFERYHVLDDSSWQKRPTVTYLPPKERQRLVDDVRELLYLQARALSRRGEEAREPSQREAQLREAWRLSEVAERESPDGAFSRAGWLQRADLARRLGQEEDARGFEARGAEAPVLTARDRFHLGLDRLGSRHYREALALLQDVTKEDPKNAWAWFCQGVCHQELGQDAEAVACYNACLALYPDSYEFHYNRGLVYQRQKRLVMAAYDFDEAIRLRPDRPEHHIARGILHAERGEHEEAVAEFTTALDHGAAQTRVYFLRARSLDQLGDAKGAARDREEGFQRTPTDEISWTARGIARLAKDPKGALADFDEALKLNPRYFAALQNKAHVLSERLNRNEDALQVLDREIEVYPDFVLGLLGRGVVRARLGKRSEALEDAKAALDRDRGPGTYYQVANIYALTSRQVAEDRETALLNLSKALRNGYGADIADTDSDFDPIRGLPEFKRIVEAAMQLRAAAKDKAY